MNNSKHFAKHATRFNTAHSFEAPTDKPTGKILWEKLAPKDSAVAINKKQAIQPEIDWINTNRNTSPENSYKSGKTYALNTVTAAAHDTGANIAVAAEIDASVSSSPISFPWKTIGSALALSGVGAAAAGGGGSSSAQQNTVAELNAQPAAESAIQTTAAPLIEKQAASDSSSTQTTENTVAADTAVTAVNAAIDNNQTVTVTAPQPTSDASAATSAASTGTASVSASASQDMAAETTQSVVEAAYSATESAAENILPQAGTVPTSSAEVSALTATSNTTVLSAEAQYIVNNIPKSANYIVVSDMSAAAAAVEANSKLTHVLISDGSHFALFSKGDTTGHVTASWGGSTWGAKFTEYVPVSAFISNISDKNITTALQNALNLAGQLKLGVEMPQDGDYTINNSITISSGVRYLHGNDSEISVQSTGSKTYAFRLTSGSTDNPFDLSDLTIDMNSLSKTFALWGEDVAGVNIHDIQVVDASHTAVLLRSLSYGSKNVTISDSTFQLNWSSTAANNSYNAIEVNNAMKKPAKTYTGSNAIWQQYLETGTIPDSAFNVSGIKITGNQISGGYYGISLSGVTNSEISENLISNNVRNISLQNHSSYNKIVDNYLADQTSSAVHLAYDSDGNTVTGNKVTTDTATGQGLFQAYQDSDNNHFANNSVEIFGSKMPRWGFYSGSDSDGNSFVDNIISGRIQKTVFGTEAIWDYNSANAQGSQAAAYMSAILGTSSSPIYYNGGIGSISNITVDGNIVDPGYRPAPVLYAGADVSTGYNGSQNIVGNINGLTFTDNTIFGKDKLDFTDVLRIHENGGATVSGLVNSGNQVLDGSQASLQTGTSSDNVFFIDSAKDTIRDSSSTDTDQVYSTVSYTLPEYVENLMLIGSTALNGTGNSGHNIIIGNAYDNVLSGGAGNDMLYGGLGNDTLTGGAGSDTFVFDSFLKSGNVDKIMDFTVGTDTIGLSSVIFGNQTDDDWFASSIDQIDNHTTVFQDGNKLYYDADGSGSHFSPIQFAELNTTEQLNAASFQIL